MRKLKPKIIAIVGPTASGKSDLALRLARLAQGKPFQKRYRFSGFEIISADSRQVYKGLDIGTGKVTQKEQKEVKHYLLDVADPKRVFSVAQFKKLGEKALKEIWSKNKIPIVVGGTGFYIDTLLRGMEFPKVPANKELRKRFDGLSAKKLFEILKKLDSGRAREIDPNNKVRLIRAIEIAKALGRVPKIKFKNPYEVLWLGVKKSEPELKKLIQKRLARRLNEGLITEVKGLVKKGMSHKRLYDLGLEYRWISNYLKKEISKEEIKNALSGANFQYAKRQMTWFKRNKEIQWVTGFLGALKLVKKFV